MLQLDCTFALMHSPAAWRMGSACAGVQRRVAGQSRLDPGRARMLIQAPGATPQDQPMSPTVPAFGDPGCTTGRLPGVFPFAFCVRITEVGYFCRAFFFFSSPVGLTYELIEE